MRKDIARPSTRYTSNEALSMIRTTSSARWKTVEEKTALDVFHAAAERVPAYKDFLKKHSVAHKKIRTMDDFLNVPITNKDNYLREYPMQSLCWDGDIRKPFVFSATSGSTGQPFYFPHGPDLDWQYSVLADLFLEQRKVNGPTLVLISFGMGVWIGGVFTFQAFELASRRGKDLSILTPGLNKSEILHAFRDLSPNFAQTILIGYPPFVKDILDDAQIEGVDIKKLNLRLMFAAESFSERFRDHLVSMTGITNPCLDTLNIYGTADIGAMAFETPTAILARRLALGKNEAFRELFGPLEKTPTLAQYNPLCTHFESPQGSVVLTGSSAMPLIRYAVGDMGGSLSFDDMRDRFADNGIDIRSEARSTHIPIYELPLVYVYERDDFSTKLYGAIIYPEHIREALQSESMFSQVSGRFAMRTCTNERHDQYLEINVEMREHAHASKALEKDVGEIVIKALLAKNSEYRNNHASMRERVHPKIILWPHEDPKYFKPTIKQKWVIHQ